MGGGGLCGTARASYLAPQTPAKTKSALTYMNLKIPKKYKKAVFNYRTCFMALITSHPFNVIQKHGIDSDCNTTSDKP